jgi:hypothetical protein
MAGRRRLKPAKPAKPAEKPYLLGVTSRAATWANCLYYPVK